MAVQVKYGVGPVLGDFELNTMSSIQHVPPSPRTSALDNKWPGRDFPSPSLRGRWLEAGAVCPSKVWEAPESGLGQDRSGVMLCWAKYYHALAAAKLRVSFLTPCGMAFVLVLGCLQGHETIEVHQRGIREIRDVQTAIQGLLHHLCSQRR
jgi:hypothetical protein